MKGTVYLLHAEDTDLYKIGLTKRPKTDKRVKELQTGNGHDIIVVHEFHSQFCNLLETSLHRFLNHKHKRGEWFKLDSDDVKKFPNKCQDIEDNLRLMSEKNIYFQNKYL